MPYRSRPIGASLVFISIYNAYDYIHAYWIKYLRFPGQRANFTPRVGESGVDGDTALKIQAHLEPRLF